MWGAGSALLAIDAQGGRLQIGCTLVRFAPVSADKDGQFRTSAQVEQLNQHYATQAQAATDPADKQKIEQEKNAKLAEVVTKSGLTVDEYNQIYMASKTDSALAAKIASLKQPASSPPSRIQ